MAYEPTVWKSGDVVTSAKLNKLEQGVASGGGGALIVHSTVNEAGTGEVLDKTWQEIKDASETSVVALEREGSGFYYLQMCAYLPFGGGKWRTGFFGNQEAIVFDTTEGANAYPEYVYE